LRVVTCAEPSRISFQTSSDCWIAWTASIAFNGIAPPPESDNPTSASHLADQFSVQTERGDGKVSDGSGRDA
jgi:hypothetical protein